ncbi:NAD(P)-dependent oxidoreductase [Kineococcus rubinsiae]|uniref:NAD(P)-dependent oxidoreductase n=1 Tax=Kineococcus rubinsiae TaxID=2609562 RepID=UPI00142FCC24|nr:NAD(P)H-binding protein [Kineococcus rubinsiae]NIZ89658.1 NAD(P)H-binding protein [Kineococcus rubinsiae]
MRVTVFGATGAIGSLIVTELLARGHTVTAYARNPAKVSAAWLQKVELVIGEMDDAAAIDSAVSNADAVISALGPSMDRKAIGLPLVTGTELVLASMKAHGVRRYIGHGTPSVLDPREKPTAQTRLVGFMGRRGLPRAYAELQGMSKAIMTAGVDWTIVRFTAPNNKAKKSSVRAGFYGRDRIGFPITRADIAAFTAAQVDEGTYVNAAPAISN